MSTVALTESESLAFIGDVPRPRQRLTRTAAEAAEFLAEVGGPVVAKVSGVAHKSDIDGVRAGLTAESLERTWTELAGLGDGTVLVAEQVGPIDFELIVGAFRDPQFGPVAMVGVGGIFAEVLSDVCFLAPPYTRRDVERALRGLRAYDLLAGTRGRTGVDPTALTDLLTRLVAALNSSASVKEIECNPVAVTAGALNVLDALVVLADAEGLAPQTKGTNGDDNARASAGGRDHD
ncbi:acetate--CoA ligase family protein [Luedemannella helvata]|uniref:Acetyl-CoA synthetase n=1 Tax=Luedemannella helvata TaxID=349315 RepID=A0ABP4VWG6_9ACTN